MAGAKLMGPAARGVVMQCIVRRERSLMGGEIYRMYLQVSVGRRCAFTARQLRPMPCAVRPHHMPVLHIVLCVAPPPVPLQENEADVFLLAARRRRGAESHRRGGSHRRGTPHLSSPQPRCCTT